MQIKSYVFSIKKNKNVTKYQFQGKYKNKNKKIQKTVTDTNRDLTKSRKSLWINREQTAFEWKSIIYEKKKNENEK